MKSIRIFIVIAIFGIALIANGAAALTTDSSTPQAVSAVDDHKHDHKGHDHSKDDHKGHDHSKDDHKGHDHSCDKSKKDKKKKTPKKK